MFFIALSQITTGKHQIKCCFSSSQEVNNFSKHIAIDQLKHVHAIKGYRVNKLLVVHISMRTLVHMQKGYNSMHWNQSKAYSQISYRGRSQKCQNLNFLFLFVAFLKKIHFGFLHFFRGGTMLFELFHFFLCFCKLDQKG